MEGRSLDEIIAGAIERAYPQGAPNEEQAYQRVLQDEDIKILLDGYRMHDRAEGLEGVIERDIRRKVGEILRERGTEQR